MPKYLIIDGYNAINKIRVFDIKRDKSLEEARLSFINALQTFMSQKHTFDRIFVVFDSKDDESGAREYSYGKVEVIFAMAHKDADKVIVDMLRDASAGNVINVASDDNFVRNHAKVFGCDVISIKNLEEIIMLKKAHRGGKILEKLLEENKVRGINEELKKHWNIK